MPKRSSKQKAPPEIAQSVPDAIVPDAEPALHQQKGLPYKLAVVAADGGEEIVTESKNPAAVALGKLGGLRGGKARAKKLSAEQRTAIARKAATARWAKKQTRQN